MYSESEYVTKYMVKLSDAKAWAPMPCVPYEMWRVPVYREDDSYAVVVQPDRVRYYVDESLPDFVKASLAMIHAFPPPKKQLHQVSVTDAYINSHDPKLNDIGWMVCKDLYIVIMHVTQLGEIGYNREKSTWQIHLNAK